MTRVNVGIKPKELCDQHLIAEWREIKRIRRHFSLHACVRSPPLFTLGRGHVLWLAARPVFVADRQRALLQEIERRGFYGDINLLLHVCGYESTSIPVSRQELLAARDLLIERIKLRLSEGRPKQPRWTKTRPPQWAAAFAG